MNDKKGNSTVSLADNLKLEAEFIESIKGVEEMEETVETVSTIDITPTDAGFRQVYRQLSQAQESWVEEILLPHNRKARQLAIKSLIHVTVAKTEIELYFKSKGEAV